MAFTKIKSLLELYEKCTEQEQIVTEVLRAFTIDHLPNYCKEKLSYNVPFFYGKKSICLIWPASIPRGGIKHGVLYGFWYGNKLVDTDQYLIHGTNKQIYYQIYKSIDDIDETKLTKLIVEAANLDFSWNKKVI